MVVDPLFDDGKILEERIVSERKREEKKDHSLILFVSHKQMIKKETNDLFMFFSRRMS